MKEQLISFETAKLAKEKGFDWRSLDRYGFVSGILYTESPIINDIEEIDPIHVSAPTQSLLQKWLRDEKDMYVVMNVAPLSNCIDYYYHIRYGEGAGKFQRGDDPLTHESYEQALEQGLINGLKLIK